MKSRQDIEQKVITVVSKQFEVEPAHIDKTAHFSALGADYLSLIELVMRIEDTFAVEINDDDAQNLVNVESITSYLAGRVS